MADPKGLKASKASDDWTTQLVSRDKKPSPLGTSVFVGLRAADAVLQYGLLRKGWAMDIVSKLGGSVFPFATPRDPSLNYLGLAPYPALIAALAAGSASKHIAWILGINHQELHPQGALIIAIFATIFNTTNTLLSCWSMTSQAPQTAPSATLGEVIKASPSLIIGLGLFSVGVTIELFAEVQRKIFKSKPENRGKPYGGGLWSLATNINYGGYTLWRAGYALASGGPVWGLLTGAWFFYDFAKRAIPSMDDYCIGKVSKDRLLSQQLLLTFFNSMANLMKISKGRLIIAFCLTSTDCSICDECFVCRACSSQLFRSISILMCGEV